MPGRRSSPETVVHCYSRGVSTLATAPTRGTPEPAGEVASSGARRVGLIADVVLGIALATGFGVVVFAATGGTDLAPNTWVEIALIAIGAACGLAVILLGARGRAWGAVDRGPVRGAGRADVRLDRVVGAAGRLLGGGEPHALLPGRVRRGGGAGQARAGPLAGARVGRRDGGGRDLRLRAARQGVPGDAQRRRPAGAPARAVLVLERDRADGRARPARVPVGRRPPGREPVAASAHRAGDRGAGHGR